MAETETSSELRMRDHNDINNNVPIPIEIVSEEEMALIEAAFALASSSSARSSSLSAAIRCSSLSPPSSPHFHTNALSIKSITLLSKRRLSTSTSTSSGNGIGSGSGTGTHPDIEDSPKLVTAHKKTRVPDSFLHRFRRKRGLSVTDLTATVLNFLPFCLFLFFPFKGVFMVLEMKVLPNWQRPQLTLIVIMIMMDTLFNIIHIYTSFNIKHM